MAHHIGMGRPSRCPRAGDAHVPWMRARAMNVHFETNKQINFLHNNSHIAAL